MILPPNSYAFVTVRSSSSRLPNKCFEPIAGNISVIQVVIRRAKEVGCPVILTTTYHSSDDTLQELADQEGISCFRGSVHNKIHRWASCFDAYEAEYALLVDGDDPTFDYNVGRRALTILAKSNADLVKPSPQLTPGFFTYGISRSGISKLLAQAPRPQTDTDVITEFIRRAHLSIQHIPAFENALYGKGLRLTVDYLEDLQFYRELYSLVDYLAPSPDIVSVALQYQLGEINWHRNKDFEDNQTAFNRGVSLGE